MSIRTKNPEKKQKAGIAITGITNQDFRKLPKDYKNSPYQSYKNKNVHN